MWFGVLGPLQVAAGEHDHAGVISAPRLRTLLSVLLWRANQPVPADELAELVWDGAPPSGAAEATRALVMRLRRQLDKQAAARIVTRAPGYAIEVSADELDASLFQTLTGQAGTAIRAGRWAQAAQAAAEALGLWRGTPLTDVRSQLLRDQWVPRLDQLHVQALEWRIEADLHDGRHVQLIPELQDLTALHPLREHFHGQLMLALYWSGRQAEALAAYRRAHDVLVTDLGVEPGPGLQDLHQRILCADPALAMSGPALPLEAEARQPAAGEGTDRPAATRWTTPRQLPAAVADFTGRQQELARLSQILAGPGGTAMIAAISGTAGVGKTTLAVRWAHQAAGEFPDGQLFVNLRGFDPAGPPVPPEDAIRVLLEGLGVIGSRLPGTAQAQSGLYRTLLAGKRMLIVLDNARDEAQVRPLLPGSLSCRVVVTSRSQLTGLVATAAAIPLSLDVMSRGEARDLLSQRLGEDRLNADPGAAAQIIDASARLPLALAVVAARAGMTPGLPLHQLAAGLSAAAGLDGFASLGDEEADVRSVLSWSYQQLDAETARAFRLASLHPGPDLDRYTLAAMCGTRPDRAGQAMAVLARGYLIQSAGPGRHGMHDLLRRYARELAAGDRDQDRDDALTRLLDYYLHAAAAAMDILFPAERDHRPRVPDADGLELPFMDPEAAREWLGAERASLANIVALAEEHGWPGHAIRIAATIARHLNTEGLYARARTIHQHAVRAAQQAGDATAETDALLWLGNAYAQQDHLQEASTCWSRALACAQAINYTRGQAGALNYLAFYADRTGQYSQAISSLEQARALHARTGNQIGEAYSLSNLGVVVLRQGDHNRAVAYQERALGLFRGCGDQYGATMALWRLGGTLLRLGDCDQADRTLRQALTQCQEFGDEQGEASIRSDIGLLLLARGQPHQAADELQHALKIFREVGDVHSQAETLNGLGETSLATGSFGAAGEQHAAALQLATQTAGLREQARAHLGRGHASQGFGEFAEAGRHWQEALRIYTQLSAPEADHVRAIIAASKHEASR